MKTADRRLLLGRRIVGFLPRPFEADGFDHRVTYDPVIVLDNGAPLTFNVDETDFGRYGVTIVYQPKKKGVPIED